MHEPGETARDGRRDLTRAVAVLAERLPEPLLPLARVVYNYAWTWIEGGVELLREVDPALWQRSGGNARWLIAAVPPRRLRALADDRGFVERLAELAARLDAYLARPSSFPQLEAGRPVAYFCSEFAVHSSLPLYGGGLGVLAGDLLKAASDLGLPMVGVGLLYRQGYFHQRLDPSGWQLESWATTHFERHPLVEVTGEDGRPLAVPVEIRGRVVSARVFRLDVGRVPLFLLDTDCAENHVIDRWITARLYIGDRHTRLAQYLVLGVGGVRALAALGIEPALVHLNEGHAALGAFERMTHWLARGRSVEEALAEVRKETVFTTHTPVAAGNEWYSVEEVEPVVGAYIERSGIPRDVIYGLGRYHPERTSEHVSITPLALRTSRAANGVSERHGGVARAMWRDLWPDRDVDAVPITHVTNGVHTTTWMAHPMQALLDRHLPAGWRERIADPAVWEAVHGIDDAELWRVRSELRGELVAYVREKSVLDRLSRAEAPDYVEAAARCFDEGTLTLGFARRVATYKRLHLLVRRLERGLRLLGDEARPIQLVIAGKAHPADHEAKRTLQRLMEVRRAPNVGSRIAFLEDYDMHMAPRIVAGVDVWLNLPRPPLEASGTSGMKVALNGGLNVSVLDGWWCEGFDGETGWAIASPEASPDDQDDHDADALLDLIENEVVPSFYERDESGLPRRWLARVKTSLARLAPRFSAERMVRDYVKTIYAPAASAPR